MKGADLKEFRITNNLTQTELGNYLGVLKGFISKIENGKEKLPESKFRKLLDNPYGWNTSMLSQSAPAEDVLPIVDESLIAELRAQICRLETKVDQLNQELGKKNAILEMLNERVKSV